MRTPLAWRNLCYRKLRTAVAIAGVSFSVLMIFMQLGFHGALANTATLLFDALDHDIALVSPSYKWLVESQTIPRSCLAQALAAPEVEKASPLYLNIVRWKNVETGQKRPAMVVGFSTRQNLFNLPSVRDRLPELERPFTMLSDRLSLPEFGPREEGTVTEISNTSFRVVGQVSIGAGFASDGTVIVSDQNYVRMRAADTLENVNVGLLSLAPGADVASTISKLRSVLPAHVKPVTRAELTALEAKYWIEATSTGMIFGSGVIVACLVGTVILYQVLSTDITNHLPEYATLKAIGFAEKAVSRIVLQQGILMAVLGFIPAFLFASVLYDATKEETNLPMEMEATTAAFVFSLTVVMCVVSALLSTRKLKLADPADLF